MTDETHPVVQWRALLAIGLVHFSIAFVPAVAADYGHLMDEFYYLACADRLAAGYVDHPPLSIWLLAAIRSLLGDSVVALRIVPAACMMAVAVLSGRLAWRLGGGRWAQLTTALAAGLVFPIAIFGTFYSMNALSLVFWIGGASILVELRTTGNPRLWLLFGATAGLAALNKHPAVAFLAVIASAYCLFDLKAAVRTKHLYLGLVLALLIVSPNLVWMSSNDWSPLEFYRLAEAKNIPTSPLTALGAQLTSMNPGTLLLLGGVVPFFRGDRLRRFGWLAVACAVVFFALVFSGQSRPDRITAIYPILFAAAATGWERLAHTRAWAALRIAIPALPVVSFAVIGPALLPVLPPVVTGVHAQWLRIIPKLEVQSQNTAIPPWIADRLGWEELAARVSAVARDQPPERTVVIGTYYGISSSIEFFRDQHPVPPVYGIHNSYHDWGPPPADVDTVITVGFDPDEVAKSFANVRSVPSRVCELCFGDRREPPITIAREPTIPLAELWPRIRSVN